MKITLKKQTTETVEVEITLPAFRRLKSKYGNTQTLLAILVDGGREVVIEAYDSAGLIMLTKQQASSLSDSSVRDFQEAEEIDADTFYELFNSIKAKI